jgi:hypothetical protein
MIKLPSKRVLASDMYQFNTLINLDKSKSISKYSMPYVIINPIMNDTTSTRLSINSNHSQVQDSIFKNICLGFNN